ncbi:MAG TPA: hypothetical protein VIY86_08420, partial [Pirellulaceae bacterium]
AVDARATNAAFQALVGALGVNVAGGSARLSNGASPATYQVRLNTISGGKYTPTSISVGNVNVVRTGSANVNLPITSTTVGGGLSPLTVDIPNIANTATTMSAPNLSQIVSGMDLVNNMESVPGGIRRYLSSLEFIFNQSVLSPNLPILGRSLQQNTLLADFGNGLAAAIDNEFVSSGQSDLPAVQRAFNEYLGLSQSSSGSGGVREGLPPGTVQLTNPCPGPITIPPPWVTPPPPIRRSLESLGVPNLVNSTNDFVQITPSMTLDLGCWYTAPGYGVFFDVGATMNQLSINAQAILTNPGGGPSPPIAAHWGSLAGKGQFDVVLNDTGTTANVTLKGDLGDPNNDTWLTTAEIAAAGGAWPNLPSNLIQSMTSTGTADVRLGVQADYAGHVIADPNLLRNSIFDDGSFWTVQNGTISNGRFEISSPGHVRQTVDLFGLGFTAAALDTEANLQILSGVSTSVAQEGQVGFLDAQITYRNAAGQAIGNPHDFPRLRIDTVGGLSRSLATLPMRPGTRSLEFRMSVVPDPGTTVRLDNPFLRVVPLPVAQPINFAAPPAERIVDLVAAGFKPSLIDSQTYYLRVNGAALAISNVNNQVVATALFLNEQGVEVSTSSVFLNQANIRGDLKSRNFSFRWN